MKTGLRFVVSISLALGCLLPVRAFSQDGLVVLKESVLVQEQKRRLDERTGQEGWVPTVEFTVRGPGIPSGANFYADFGYAGKPKWLKIECKDPDQVFRTTDQWRLFCVREYGVVGTAHVGAVNFALHMTNPLTETDTTLFKGTFKVGKVPPPYTDEFYVDDDWRFPIGYVYFDSRDAYLTARFWFRGNSPEVSAHLFYQGKEIAKYSSSGLGATEWANRIYQWQYMETSFQGVYRTPEQAESGYEPNFAISKNPGEYEIKVLLVRQLARSIKFTVLPDGTIDNSIGNANKLGSDWTLVPVRVVGTLNEWKKLAWKTEVFYGNPLTGFAVGP